MRKRTSWGLVSVLGLAAAAAAQTPSVAPDSLANTDVVTLAKAGFTEDFIVDLIQTSRTRFDTSVTGLSELAKAGMTERLIRAVMSAARPELEPTGQRGDDAAGSPPHPERTRVLKRSETAVALTNQTPYRRSFSVFWGLWKKETEVTPPAPLNSGAAFGKTYGPVRRAPAASGDTRYVVFP